MWEGRSETSNPDESIDSGEFKKRGGGTMPLAQLTGLSGFLSAEQKGELIRKVTDTIASVEGVRVVTHDRGHY